MYGWVKAFHLITIITWFAGLFYLPRLYVYHAMAGADVTGSERFKVMERKLYYGIMTPSMVLTVVFGLWLIGLRGFDWLLATHWLQLKLFLVTALIAYHFYLGAVLKQFRTDSNQRSHVFYRWLNEMPVLVLIAVVCLAVLKPSW